MSTFQERRLGKNQQLLLQALAKHGEEWHPRCGWSLEGVAATQRMLDVLIGRGLVTRLLETRDGVDVPVYRLIPSVEDGEALFHRLAASAAPWAILELAPDGIFLEDRPVRPQDVIELQSTRLVEVATPRGPLSGRRRLPWGCLVRVVVLTSAPTVMGKRNRIIELHAEFGGYPFTGAYQGLEMRFRWPA